MQRVLCYLLNNETPIFEFETSCLPRIGELMKIRGDVYEITFIAHRFREIDGINKHEITFIIKPEGE